jgi:hypothetical protein
MFRQHFEAFLLEDHYYHYIQLLFPATFWGFTFTGTKLSLVLLRIQLVSYWNRYLFFGNNKYMEFSGNNITLTNREWNETWVICALDEIVGKARFVRCGLFHDAVKISEYTTSKFMDIFKNE